MRVPRAAVYAAFLFSGLTALVYQIIWSRYLTLLVGGTSVAQTIVLATFMGGLAFGNAFFGRRADHARTDRLRLYALLEVGIGLSCLLFPAFFDVISRTYLALAAVSGPGATVNHVLKVLLAAASMFLPCALMGGTLPVLAKYVVDSMSGLGARIGWLYFVNTAGAVVGCVVGGFYVVEAWGLEAGIIGASLGNLAIGGIFYFWSKRASASAPAAPQAPREAGESEVALPAREAAPEEPRAERAAAAAYNLMQARVAFWCIAVAGAVSMLYELTWTRVLTLSIGGTVHSFSTMLISFISGIAIGSWLAGRIMRRPVNALALFGLCEIGIALSILIPLRWYERLPFAFHRIGSWLAHTPETYGLYLLGQVLLAALVMVVPTTLIGAALPLASRVCVEGLDVVGRRVGNVFSVNTVGTVMGAVLTGFVLLPALGIRNTLLLGGSVSAALGVALLWAWRPRGAGAPSVALLDAVRPSSPVQGPAAWPLAAGTAAVAVLAVALTASWDPRLMQQGLFRWGPSGFKTWEEFRRYALDTKFVYVRDGADGTVSVQERSPTHRAIRVNGKPDASTLSDMPTQLMVGHLPMLFHPDPKSAMVVGLGSGATASAVLHHPGVHADVAEISPEMLEAARFFEPWTAHVLANPRMSLYVMDAREFLLVTRNHYDVIVSEPTNIWIPGVANLFTRDFYRVVRSRLQPGGIFAQWMQSYSADPVMVATVIASLSREFPYVSAWLVAETDLVLLASDVRPRFDPDLFTRRLAALRPTFDVPMERKPGPLVMFHDPVLFLAHQVGTGEAVAMAWPAAALPAYFDLRPRLEFQAARAQYVGATYPIRDQLDCRVTPLGREPLFIEEYLERHPLDTQRRLQLASEFEQLGPGFRHLRSAVAAALVRLGEENPLALLNASEATLAAVTLSRSLGQRIDGPGRPEVSDCLGYLRAEHAILREGRSVFAPLPIPGFEARVARCVEAQPDQTAQFRAGAARAMADAGAREPALRFIRTLEEDGSLQRLDAGEASGLLTAGSMLLLEEGRYEDATPWVRKALDLDHSNATAARLALGLKSRGLDASPNRAVTQAR